MPNVGAQISGAFSVLLTIAAIFLPHPPLKVLFLCLAAFAWVIASYLVWRDSLRSANETIEQLDAEIRRLKDFDESQEQLAEEKLKALNDDSIDAVCFLLHHGETEIQELEKHCSLQPGTRLFNDALQQARGVGFIIQVQAPVPGRASVKYSWKVKPEFESALRYLLAKRETKWFR